MNGIALGHDAPIFEISFVAFGQVVSRRVKSRELRSKNYFYGFSWFRLSFVRTGLVKLCQV